MLSMFFVLKGDWLLHVSHRWLRGGRCHSTRQRCPLYQSLLWAQLLLSGHHRGQPKAYRHLCLSPHLLWRRAHLWLQVPHRGCQQQAALQLWSKEVSQVPQLTHLFPRMLCEDCRSVAQLCHNYRTGHHTGVSCGFMPVFWAQFTENHTIYRAWTLSVFLLVVKQNTAGTSRRTVNTGCAILEEGPFVKIPTYCASFSLIYMWHGKFRLLRCAMKRSEPSQHCNIYSNLHSSHPVTFSLCFYIGPSSFIISTMLWSTIAEMWTKKKIKELGSVLHQSAICWRDLEE